VFDNDRGACEGDGVEAKGVSEGLSLRVTGPQGPTPIGVSTHLSFIYLCLINSKYVVE
jgi:hypothetical protein